jgi:ankyrin repeat protein
MATVSRGLPSQPHLDVPRREARDLLNACRRSEPQAFERIRYRHPKFKDTPDSELASAFRLSDAQLVIAREYGLAHWTELKERINSNGAAWLLDAAIRSNDVEKVVSLLRDNPKLIHVPVRSGNWGPPLSHASNLGRLDVMKAIAPLGARDFQHAFDRALLQGRLDCVKWLHEQGAELLPGIVMGCCETLSIAGLRFLHEVNAPFTDGKGNHLAPVAMILETYTRNPAEKHQVLDLFELRGARFPDTPMMALHRGQVDRLREQLKRDPGLLSRCFSYGEIYLPELGCAEDSRSGCHGTPIGGTTLLHLAIEFDEQEVFELLLERGVDPNARALMDPEGFGGHTPLFSAVVNASVANGRQRDAGMARALLKSGADLSVRACLRKFMDWCETPGWHEARNVTAAEWARGYPDKASINAEALKLLAD